MELFKITGGTPLQGSVKAAGAKNAITKMLVASLLSDKSVKFTNVPNILEVEVTVDLCKEVGAQITWDREKGALEIVTPKLIRTEVHQRFSGANRIPILMLGALLGRTQEPITVPTMGGCKIGKRPVDFHIQALEQMGAKIDSISREDGRAYVAQAKMLKGSIIHLPYPSVGATENAIFAGCRAKGTTLIKNAAVEPEIIDLILFLQKLGVIIRVDINRSIYIQETKEFFEAEHRVLTDRIEAASLGMAAIATKGCVFVEGAQQSHMISFLNKLRTIGGGFLVKENGIEFFYKGPLQGNLHLETDVHPGFLTDWLQPFVVLLTQSRGCSVIHETVYENRFGYAKTIKEMGADIELFTQCLGGKSCRFASQNFDHSLIVKGPTPLYGKRIDIPDLRAGFAYVMAALIAPNTSEITGLRFLDRGYENLEGKLASLGANIERVRATKKLESLLTSNKL
ncbi:MAG: UDP-N-acetylglucosamine 1-carboxyvinyltransferase [Candidatus Algichlamydia australiensis]|nr:UDP-N-acetylglucosamine 1-carboxyvinyltransferase [Chlamydiales bacterium]